MISWVFINDNPLPELIRNNNWGQTWTLDYSNMLILRYAHPYELKWRFEIRSEKNPGDVLWELETSASHIWDVIKKIENWRIQQFDDAPIESIRQLIRNKHSGYFYFKKRLFFVTFRDGEVESNRYYMQHPDNYMVHFEQKVPYEFPPPNEDTLREIFEDFEIVAQWNNWTSVVIQK